jgi:hypothetical protein
MTKYLFFLLTVLCVFSASFSFAADEKNGNIQDGFYSKYILAAKKHREEIRTNGLAYIAGGALGLSSSIYLSIKSRDPLSKVGYSLIQALSTASIAYGANRYFIGDGFTLAAERLERTENEFRKSNVHLSNTILNELALNELEQQKEQYKKEKKIRAAVSLCSAISAGTTLAFSKKKTSSASLTLGFIGFISLGAAISDFISNDIPTSFSELYARNYLEIDPLQKRIFYTWHW